ncbi:MAG TPA: histidine kinase [Puia sp.]|jgi:two-component system LytT family sensor kinase|nr:histidine kinase [Puia sp.]
MRRIAVIGLHCCYWGMYVLLILLFAILGAHTIHFPVRVLLLPGGFFVYPAVIAFYLFYFLLFPRLLQRKRLPALGLAAIGTSLVSSLFALGTLRLLLGPRVQINLSWDTAGQVLVLAFIAFANGILALVIRGFITWYVEIRLKEELRRRNTEMELELLRSQLNPHFLFNTLNNIDVLIEKDAARASGYLQQLSGLLRFMLYEVQAEKIPISAELSNIEKYIQLQKIRTAHPDSIQYSVEGETEQWMIEPMLFLPFIENAFKHAEKKAGNAILIRFRLERERIRFDCENRYQRKSKAGPGTQGGLGDSLIRKRLMLLYPGRHVLEVEAGDDTYKTTLILTGHAN